MTSLLQLSFSSHYPRGRTLGAGAGVDRNPGSFLILSFLTNNSPSILVMKAESTVGSSSLSEVPKLTGLCGLTHASETACVRGSGAPEAPTTKGACPPGSAEGTSRTETPSCHGRSRVGRRSSLLLGWARQRPQRPLSGAECPGALTRHHGYWCGRSDGRATWGTRPPPARGPSPWGAERFLLAGLGARTALAGLGGQGPVCPAGSGGAGLSTP